jgi:hypothetical protein
MEEQGNFRRGRGRSWPDETTASVSRKAAAVPSRIQAAIATRSDRSNSQSPKRSRPRRATASTARTAAWSTPSPMRSRRPSASASLPNSAKLAGPGRRNPGSARRFPPPGESFLASAPLSPRPASYSSGILPIHVRALPAPVACAREYDPQSQDAEDGFRGRVRSVRV